MSKFDEKLRAAEKWDTQEDALDAVGFEGPRLLPDSVQKTDDRPYDRHDVFEFEDDARTFVDRELEPRGIDYDVIALHNDEGSIAIFWYSAQWNHEKGNTFSHVGGKVPVLTPVGV